MQLLLSSLLPNVFVGYDHAHFGATHTLNGHSSTSQMLLKFVSLVSMNVNWFHCTDNRLFLLFHCIRNWFLARLLSFTSYRSITVYLHQFYGFNGSAPRGYHRNWNRNTGKKVTPTIWKHRKTCHCPITPFAFHRKCNNCANNDRNNTVEKRAFCFL